MRWQPECVVVPCQGAWIVYAPSSGLLMHMNESAAARFRGMLDRPVEFAQDPDVEFAPHRVTVALSFDCPNRCVYCFGSPAHQRKERLDKRFFRRVMAYVSENAQRKGRNVYLTFQGAGEPLGPWDLLQECIRTGESEARQRGCDLVTQICTSGQVEEAEAHWIADNFDQVTVSFDGLPEFQRRQRPRADRRDPVPAPLRLLRYLHEVNKRTTVNIVITRDGLHRMPEMVEFLACDVCARHLRFFRMESLPHVQAAPAPIEEFIQYFRLAHREGAGRGVLVDHGVVSMESLSLPFGDERIERINVAPPNLIMESFSFHADVTGAQEPAKGVWGRYDQESDTLMLDLPARRAALTELMLDDCLSCPLLPACFACCGLRERLPGEATGQVPACEEKRLVLEELLLSASRRNGIRGRIGPTLGSEETGGIKG